jgi:hypothetical protein
MCYHGLTTGLYSTPFQVSEIPSGGDGEKGTVFPKQLSPIGQNQSIRAQDSAILWLLNPMNAAFKCIWPRKAAFLPRFRCAFLQLWISLVMIYSLRMPVWMQVTASERKQ